MNSDKFYTYALVQGNDILYRYIENGQQYAERIPYSPTLYKNTQIDSPLKTLRGELVAPMAFNTIRDAREHIKQFDGVHGYDIYGNTNYEQQMLRDEFPTAVNYQANLIRGHFFDIEVHSDEGFPKPEDARHPVTAISIYDTLSKSIMVLCQHPEQKFDKSKLAVHPVLRNIPVMVKQCQSEQELLLDWVKIIKTMQPNWMSGWNSEKFDIPYLVHRIVDLFGEAKLKELSPFGSKLRSRVIKDDYGNESKTYQIVGIPHLDYLEVYKKHTFITQESYKLDHIAEVELGEKKLEFEGTLKDLYLNDFQTYIEYSIQDSNLLARLDDKLRLMDVTYALAYFCKVNYIDTMSPVKSWEGILYNKLLDKNIVQPLEPSGRKEGKFSGAHVKIPQLGLKKWIVSCDLNSLYPHLYQQYNLGVDTILSDIELPTEVFRWKQQHLGFLKSDSNDDEVIQQIENKLINRELDTSILKKHKIALAPNGSLYRTDVMSIMSEVTRELYANRKGFKKTMLAAEQKKVDAKNAGDKAEAIKWENEEVRCDNMQMAMKILLNSGYGAGGTDSFKYFNVEVAEATTRSGRLSIRWIAARTNEFLNKLLGTNSDYIVAIDTDSVYIDCEALVNHLYKGQIPSDDQKVVDLLDQIFETKIVGLMGEWYEELAQYMNAYENRMFMAREVIAPRALWTAKKRYIMEVWNSEGVAYNPPKNKVMGLEAVRSTTPQMIRNKLKEAYKVVLRGTNDDMIEFISVFREEYKQKPLLEIATGSSVNGLQKYSDPKGIFIKGTPAHVKASLIFNHEVEKRGLGEKYEPIKEGEKMKYVRLQKPNLLMQEVCGFVDKLPPEFKLENKIDRDEMFTKAFLNPMQKMLDLLNWKAEKQADLSAFF